MFMLARAVLDKWKCIILWMLVAPCCFADDIAYLAYTDAFWQVWLIKEDGSDPRQLTRSSYDKNSISWFPDGKHLLVNGSQGGLVKLDIKNGEEVPIDFPFTDFADAVLSPDGKRVAFSFNAADGSDDNNIWVADIDGSHRKKLTDMPWLQHEPRWSRDGSILFFLSGHGQQVHDIWAIDMVSGNKEQLTVGQLYNFDVHSGADGSMYFSSNRSGNYEIWLRDVSGKDMQLTNDPGFDASPALSPDGASLVFESSRGGRTNLWVMNMATRAIKQLTNHKMGSRKPVYFYPRKEGGQ